MSIPFPYDPNTSPLWNLYDISDNNPEFQLFTSVIVEKNDIAGFPIQYYIKKYLPEDPLYGENTLESFEDPRYTKVTYEPGMETPILNAFGIMSDDEISLVEIPKYTFTRDISADKPLVGDVVKTLWNNRNYEITDVEEEQRIFHAKKMVWNIILRPFRFGDSSNKSQEIEFGEIFDDMSLNDIIDGTLSPSANITTTESISGNHIPIQNPQVSLHWGNNDFIETQSNDIFDYKGKIDPDDVLYLNPLKWKKKKDM